MQGDQQKAVLGRRPIQLFLRACMGRKKIQCDNKNQLDDMDLADRARRLVARKSVKLFIAVVLYTAIVLFLKSPETKRPADDKTGLDHEIIMSKVQEVNRAAIDQNKDIDEATEKNYKVNYSAVLSSSTRRFAHHGQDINCHQLPLNYYSSETELKVEFEPPSSQGARFAYAWYVASNAYFCSALAALKLLKQLRENEEENFPYKVDYVMVYVNQDLVGRDNQRLFNLWKEEGGLSRNFTSLKKGVLNNYYRETYQKFHTFLLTDYDRVITMDADGFAQHSLDHLFLIKFPENVFIAAPQAYWMKNQGIATGTRDNCPGVPFVDVTTVLLVFRPSRQLFSRVKSHFGTWRTRTRPRMQNFDMDIVNKEFCCRDQLLVLPKVYGTLDSEYNKNEKLHKGVAECRNFDLVHYLHFTSHGKPWMEGRSDRKLALESYGEDMAMKMFGQWYRTFGQVCPRRTVPKLES